MSSSYTSGSPTSTAPSSTTTSSPTACNAHPSRCPFCLGPVCPIEQHQVLHVKQCQLDEEGELLEMCDKCGKVHPDEIINEDEYDPRAWEGEGLSQ